MTGVRPSREIGGKGRIIGDLLAGCKYPIHYDTGHRGLIEESSVPFRAHAEFRKAELDALQVLYQELAERIRDPERLAQEAVS